MRAYECVFESVRACSGLSDSEHEQRDRVNVCACLLVCIALRVLAC